MTIDRLRKALEAQPFQPFTIHLVDEREVFVRLREFTILSPRGRTLIVYQADDSFDIIDLMLVTDLEVKPELAVQTNGLPNAPTV